MVPGWLHILSITAILVGIACALTIAVHVVLHPQRMWIMNLVWPVTAVFGTAITLWLYFRYGVQSSKWRMQDMKQHAGKQSRPKQPFPVVVAKGASHCGAGCSLGDLCAEWLAFAFPVVAVWFGWESLFSERLFAVWILDYVFAFVFGIAFQYFTIAPMRNLDLWQGLWQAVKVDTLSLTAWQVGMYGFMAIAYFWIFRGLLGVELEVSRPEFWFTMQIAMLCGWATSYPVNWWLIRSGIKEAM